MNRGGGLPIPSCDVCNTVRTVGASHPRDHTTMSFFTNISLTRSTLTVVNYVTMVSVIVISSGPFTARYRIANITAVASTLFIVFTAGARGVVGCIEKGKKLRKKLITSLLPRISLVNFGVVLGDSSRVGVSL